MLKFFTSILACLLTYFAISQTATSILNGNNIATQLNTGAVFFNNPGIMGPSYEYPAGSSNHLIYATSFWFAGEDSNGQLTLSGQKYALGQDMFPGPLTTTGAAEITPSVALQYDQIWSVTKSDIDYHIQNFGNTGYVVPSSIAGWPAHGNVAESQDFYLAPFVDADNDGLYDPSNGDYPLIRGDVAYYMILNDKLDVHSESGGNPLGIECHFMFYQYQSDDYLNNTTFLHLKVINRGTQLLNDFKVACFMDPDIGDANDDFMGCDSTKNVMYAYNGSATDSQYGSKPPAVGVVSLNRDAHAVMHYSNFAGPAAIPSVASEYWLNMDGYFNNGAPFTYGGSGIGGTTTTKFHYHGNPNNPGDWSEYTEGNPPTDKKVMMSIAPETLTSGIELCYDFAFIVGDGGDHIQNVDSLLNIADQVQAFYDAQTNLICENYEQYLTLDDKVVIEPKVFPNPADDYLNIQLQGSFDVAVYTLDGRLVLSQTGLADQYTLDLDLSSGTYLLEVKQGNALHNELIIVR